MALFDQPAVIVDLETTGANPALDRVTEVGILEVAGGEVVREWESLVNPQTPIPAFIEAMTGITNQMVSTAPTFHELRHELQAMLRGRIFFAHNARFDYGFLKNEFLRVDLPFQEMVLCTVKLSRRLWPEHRSHGLDAIIARHGIVCEQRHRALGDARALWEFLRCVRDQVPADRIEEAAQEVLRRTFTPPNLAPGVMDSIPDSPGVYRFFGANEALLYVGKSGNMRTRAMAHFSGNPLSARDRRLGEQVRHVDWIETAGELGALLKQARSIREDAPLNNQALRRAGDVWSLRLRRADLDAGQSVEVTGAQGFELTALDQYFGLFRSQRAAERAVLGLASTHGLCHRLLGLDGLTGPCVAYPLRKCKGACVGLESVRSHDLRLLAAMAPLSLKQWPYRGRIGIREHDTSTGRTDIHIVDHWCYLGTAASDADLQYLLEGRTAPAFDVDSYRLFTRFLGSRREGIRVIDLDLKS